jgi:hypothetical protein
MKQKALRFFVLFIITSLCVSFIPLGHGRVEAAVSDWQKGASIFSVSQEDFASDSFKESVRNLKGTGANYVALILPYHQANKNASDVYASWDTPSDSALTSAINYIHSQGMKVMLKPHLASDDGLPWRAWIDAGDRDRWFASYGSMLNHLGDIGKQTGAEGITIATELITMSTYTSNGDNTQRWNKMIADLRTHFNGTLTYSANWGSDSFAEEVAHIGFWPQLDYIGISAYYPLAGDQWDPSVEAMVGSWSYWDQTKIKPLADQYGKQVIFTEVGYRSADHTNADPWDGGRGGNVNLEMQRKLYQALFQYWNNQSHIAGVYLWDWDINPNGGGSGNNHYTPQHKPAQDVMTTWFGGNGQTPPPTDNNNNNNGSTSTPGNNNGGTPGNSGDGWSIMASGGTTQVNTQVTTPVTITSPVGLSDSIVDVEVFDQSNNRVLQKFFEHETLNGGATQTYQVSWTPQTAGMYGIKVGVFNNNWTTAYHWNGNAGSVDVSGNGQPSNGGNNNNTGNTGNTGNTNNGTGNTGSTNSGSVTTNIWWPTDGAAVTGTQPFKAMLEGRDVSTYSMYWQVDGDRLNEMYNSDVDYPHKEAWVDVSGWNWKGGGPYNINFISKDSSGTTISQSSVNIRTQ